MALSTYSELQTSIAGFLNRDDLSATIPDFISLAEANIQRDLRHWRMEERSVTVLDSRYTPKPGDWIDTIRFTVNSQGYRELRLISMAEMSRRRAESGDSSGVPQFYNHSQDEIEVHPTPSATYEGELVYRKRIVPLSDAEPTNWLLGFAPDVYLYGSLVHSAPFLHDDARLSVWAALYGAAVEKLNNESTASAWSSGTMTMGAPNA